MNELIIKAISEKKLLSFYYDGGQRVIKPHCYGITTAGNEGLRAFQISGYSTSGKMGWKMFYLSKASNIKVLDNQFANAELGYKRGDKGMSNIYCEL